MRVNYKEDTLEAFPLFSSIHSFLYLFIFLNVRTLISVTFDYYAERHGGVRNLSRAHTNCHR